MKKSSKKILAFFVITVSVFAVFGAGSVFRLFDYLESKTYDLRVNTFADANSPSDEIVAVILDQNSLDWARKTHGWGWPWPRTAYSDFIEYMKIGRAKSLAFDVLFTEDSIYGEADDAEFARAEREFGGFMQSAHFSVQNGDSRTMPLAASDKPFFDTVGFGGFLQKFALKGEAKGQFPIPELLVSAGALGSTVGIPDSDGVVRRLALFTLFDGKAVPSEAAASLILGGFSRQVFYDAKKKSLVWNGRNIPVDKDGKTLLRFKGHDFDRYTPYPISLILQSAEAYKNGEMPELPPGDFKDKYVFFGYYAPGLYDTAPTPISSVYPGMGTHITMMDNILQYDFTRETPLWLNLFIIFAAITLVGGLTIFPNKVYISLGSLIASITICVSTGFLAYENGWWLPMVAPFFSIIIAYLTATLYNYATEGSQKRFIKSAFSQYLSLPVIEQLLANPDQLKLGGERREISIFFSDIQGFSTISERLDPTTLTELLNDYLSFMTNIILDSGGTIDKYEGDAIIAFWNAPLSYPDHAARALGAAMECQHSLAEQQSFYEEKYGASLITRIGLNTGFAVVGNMGSNKHFNYTMLGDSVNLAARLEGLNKQFGTFLMCTEKTFNDANKTIPADGQRFVGRKLASVAVVGKKEPATVYQPLFQAVYMENLSVLQKFDKARDLFYEGKFLEASPLFEEIVNVDKPSFFYAEQCRYYIKHPDEWKGFWQATSK
ncbi:MAG: adenylate/guanylate cyclase domain-containing protein [Treponema sp.]|jgi:adenylate cyclase|nr:adenylate/guanylate cyclase domain-containing protein [Treponema sp.]